MIKVTTTYFFLIESSSTNLHNHFMMFRCRQGTFDKARVVKKMAWTCSSVFGLLDNNAFCRAGQGNHGSIVLVLMVEVRGRKGRGQRSRQSNLWKRIGRTGTRLIPGLVVYSTISTRVASKATEALVIVYIDVSSHYLQATALLYW